MEFKTIYAHNVRISSINEVEQAFSQYIKDWKAFPVDTVPDKRPTIVERRLSVVPHNSWRALGGGSPSFVSLNREEGMSGSYQSSGALKIINFPLDPLIALAFKLEYRGKPQNY